MTPEAERLRRDALASLAQRVLATMKAREHTVFDLQRETGLSHNKAWKSGNPHRRRPNGERYGPLDKVADVAAALDYCGLDWADIGERKAPANWSEVEATIRALPDLRPCDADTLCAVLMVLYQRERSSGDVIA